MAIALAVEDEAARRYDDLAGRMERRGEAELAGLFSELAELERIHGQELAGWAQRVGGSVPPPLSTPWTWPETFDEGPGDEGTGGAPLDPFRALAIAVRNEERAFALYTYLAALCDGDATLRERAESLAREELNHVARLRAWRRRVWHARPLAHPMSLPVGGTVVDLNLLAAGLESGCAQVEEMAASALAAESQADVAAILSRCADDDRRRAQQLLPAATPRPAPSATVTAAQQAGLPEPGALTAAGVLRLAVRNAEEVVESYLSVAERSGNDEATLIQAQRLAEGAIMRLALLQAQCAGDT